MFPLSTTDLEELHLSSEALKTRTIEWIISQISWNRDLISRLPQYLQTILNSERPKKGNEETTINRFQDTSLEIKLLAGFLYPNTMEREYDDLNGDTLLGASPMCNQRSNRWIQL
ncbi:hypothetical protein FRC19_005784 [Serendipita sp. 401]|nr:hypothetical protein FRC19_005784 [Serendipita sp. 401]KAG9052106.1 hypothetical protein FS842_010489 [Serendipita sp. 407]